MLQKGGTSGGRYSLQCKSTIQKSLQCLKHNNSIKWSITGTALFWLLCSCRSNETQAISDLFGFGFSQTSAIFIRELEAWSLPSFLFGHQLPPICCCCQNTDLGRTVQINCLSPSKADFELCSSRLWTVSTSFVQNTHWTILEKLQTAGRKCFKIPILLRFSVGPQLTLSGHPLWVGSWVKNAAVCNLNLVRLFSAMVLPFHFLPNTIQRKTSEKSSFSSSLTLSYLLLLLLQPLPTACYFAVPDLSLENVNTAIQLTQILYKVSSPYSDNLQWESFYPETFWQSESYEEEHEEEEEEEEDEEEGWAWMSDFSVDSWLPNWSAEEDICH